MPSSLRRRAAQIRRRYTGEKDTAARAGVGRDGSHGLDECSPAQAQLRSLIALGFLNSTHSDLGWSLSVLSAYTTTVSPRYDRLVLVADAPTNVAEHLVPNDRGNPGLPGLRHDLYLFNERAEDDYNITHVLRHLPTGGRIVVTDHPAGKVTGEPRETVRTRLMLPVDVQLRPAEEALLRAAPPMSASTRTLLAAVFCRRSTRDPAGGWALGSWFYDPLNRTDRGAASGDRRLTGTGDTWELRWTGYPYLVDVIACLTDPAIGLAGLTVTRDQAGIAVHFETASLRLLWGLM